MEQLPWLSQPDTPWPTRRPRRKRKQSGELSKQSVELPSIQQATNGEAEEPTPAEVAVPRPETPSTSQPQSDGTNSTNPTTPSSSTQAPLPAARDTTPVAPKSAQKARVPAVPVVPALPKASPRDAAKQIPEKANEDAPVEQSQGVQDETKAVDQAAATDGGSIETPTPAPAPKAWSTPKLWAGLFNPNAETNSATSGDSGRATGQNFGKANTESVAEALRSFSAVAGDSKVSFLKPRGLINTGNMCYMNSVSYCPILSLGFILILYRFCKFLSPVLHFSHFLIKLGSVPLIVSRAKLP